MTGSARRRSRKRSRRRGGLRLGRKTGRWIAGRMGVKKSKRTRRRRGGDHIQYDCMRVVDPGLPGVQKLSPSGQTRGDCPMFSNCMLIDPVTGKATGKASTAALAQPGKEFDGKCMSKFKRK